MAPKKEGKGTARKKIRKGALKDLGPTGRRGGTVKGGARKKTLPLESW